MNLANILFKFSLKFKRVVQSLYFCCIQKPIWKLSYNSGSNSFVCDGKLRNCRIHISGHGHKIKIMRGVIMNDVLIEVSGNGHSLFIGENARFGYGGRIRIEDNNNTVKLLEGSHFVNVFFSIADNDNSIMVGKDCLFSAQVIIRASDGHSILDEENKRCNHGQPVIIGDRVWIGYGVTVLKGSNIGNDSIVGTLSLLPGKCYPNHSIIGGNPGKTLKQGYHWCYNRISDTEC